MCCIKLLFSCVAFWPCPVFCCPAGHPAVIFFLKPSSKILLTIPSTMMLLVQNTPSSSSSNPFKYDTLLYLGSSVGERNIFCSAVSVIVSLGIHCWRVPVPYSRLEEGQGPQPVDGFLRKIWSPHWGPPRKKRKTGWPWEVLMENRDVTCIHRLRTLTPKGSIMSFHFQLLIPSSILVFLQQVSLSSTLRHKSNQPCYWVKFSGDA